jgi:hypothetical protein
MHGVTRPRDQILGNLETLYREAYGRAADDEARHALDFGFRRDQLWLEAILDVRDLLAAPPPAAGQGGTGDKSVLEQINDLRSLARLPFGR